MGDGESETTGCALRIGGTGDRRDFRERFIYGFPVMKRRDLLKLGAAATALAATGVSAQESSAPALAVDFLPRGLEGLGPMAEAVLPAELGASGQREALTAFMAWIRDHEAGRYLEHGYGHTRVAKTAAAPVGKYPTQLQALDAAARRHHGKAFGALDFAARRGLIAAEFVALKIDSVDGPPSGGHVAADLMSHYFSSIEANDLCYEAEIGRDSCRSLEGSSERPEPLARRRAS